MRILVITNYYPPLEVGGYEQLCRDVTVRLAQRGHQTAVLTSDHGVKHRKSDADVDGIFRELVIQPDYSSRLDAAWQFFLTRGWADRHNRRCLRRITARMQPDAIFVWNLQGLTRRLALEAESMPGVAVAYWLAGYSPAEPDEFWYYWSIQPKLRSHLGGVKTYMSRVAFAIMHSESQPVRLAMRHVAVVSHFMRDKGIADGTLPRDTQVIYNGVEVDRFLHPVQSRGQGPLRLLQAGRVSADKGVHTAVEAVGYLVREQGLNDVHLTVAGSGRADYRTRLDEIVRRFDLDKHVTMTGWLPRERMPALMAESHILLLPTIIQEGFARVVLEAMASGLAVVATNTGGTSEIVQHDMTGLLVPADDSRSLAEKIFRLARDDDLRQRLASAAQQIVCQRFSLDRMVDEMEAFLAHTLEH